MTGPKEEKHLVSCYHLHDGSLLMVSCLTSTKCTNLWRLQLWRVYSDTLCVEWWTLGASCVGGHPAWQQLRADPINTALYPALSYTHHSTVNAFVLCAGVIDNSTLLDCDIMPVCVDQRGWNPLATSSARLEAKTDGSIKGCTNKNKLECIWACRLLYVHSLSGCPKSVRTHMDSHTSSESLNYAVVHYFPFQIFNSALIRIYAISCGVFHVCSWEQKLACLSFRKQWWGQGWTGSSSCWCIQLSDPTLKHNPCEEPREKIQSASELQTSNLCHTIFYCDTGRRLICPLFVIALFIVSQTCRILVVVVVKPLLCSDNCFCCCLYQEALLTEPFLLCLLGDFICSALLSWALM